MAQATEATNAWIKRVLGVDPHGQGEPLVPQGTVAYRSALLAFAQARSSVSAQLKALRAAIVADLPEEADLAQLLEFELSGLNADIGDAVDDAINATGEDRQAAEARTRALLEGYVARLGNYPLVEHIDSNPFVSVDIGKTLTTALNDIITRMP